MKIEAIFEVIRKLPESKRLEALLSLIEYQDFIRERELNKEKENDVIIQKR